MGIAFSFTVLVITLVVLGFSSSRIVKLLTGISSLLRVPKFLLSFVVLGLGTSLPDLMVSGIAASAGEVDLLLASIIGANLIVLCVVLAVVTIRKGAFQVREQSILENFGWIFFVIAIPFFLLMDNRLTVLEGLILVVVYLMYLFHVREQAPVAAKEEEHTHQMFPSVPKQHNKTMLLLEMLVFLGIALVASNVIVNTAVEISASFNIHPILLGFTIISLGIAIPELVLDLSALSAREEEVIWGDLIGSFITELTLVLGLAAVIGGSLSFTFDHFIVGYGFMVLAFLLVFFFAFRKKVITRTEGVMLLLLYIIFLSVQFDLIHVQSPIQSIMWLVP
ncbi:hypothetical protein KJ765_06375 [Candidatus Micrarchaeota archaeon]|nr:hypothetical protein [Candidatus Micrarchaeota archaeon]